MEKCKYWNEFIEEKKNKRKNQISEQVVRAHFEGRKTTKGKRRAYRQTAEYEEALQKAMEEDEAIVKLNSIVPGDEKILPEYRVFEQRILDEFAAQERENFIEQEVEKIKSHLEELDQSSFFDDINQEIVDIVREDIKRTLSKGKITVRKTWFYDWEYQKGIYDHPKHSYEDLSLRNFDDFLDQISNEYGKEDLFFYSQYDESDILNLILEKAKRDEMIRFYAENEDEDLQDAALEEINDIVYINVSEYKVIEDATESFTREEVEQLVMDNPFYQDLKKELMEQEKADLRMKEEVLSRVPDKAKFLYPAARGMKRHFILHIGPTNSGKTHDALEEFRKAEKGVYLAPLRLLALEVYENTVEHGIPCNMVTGEEEILTKEATHTSQTIEMASLQAPYDVAVIDEAQMIADPQRGGAWTAVILGICAELVHICMAPHAAKIVKQLIEYCGDDWEERYHERLTPLEAEEGVFHFPKDVREGDALIVFSKRSVLSCAAELQAKGIKCSVIYGNLPYSVRRKETEAFLSGERKVVVATDAIGMGLNLPVKRIVFLENEKFDGKERRLLKADEIQQITGRAGRKGMHDIGYYTAENGMKYIRKNAEKEVPAITSARFHFPKTLITVNGKLSEIIEKWLETEHEATFLKTDLTDILLLCRELEAYTKDKELIYTFCNLPFNQKDMEMKSLWKDLFFEVHENGVVNSRQYDFSNYNSLSWLEENDQLKVLESSYQKFDMLYQCVTHYGDPETKAEEKHRILTKKEVISSQINEILSKQKLTRKKCRDCGRALPWKYPYSICQKCYNSRYDWY